MAETRTERMIFMRVAIATGNLGDMLFQEVSHVNPKVTRHFRERRFRNAIGNNDQLLFADAPARAAVSACPGRTAVLALHCAGLALPEVDPEPDNREPRQGRSRFREPGPGHPHR